MKIKKYNEAIDFTGWLHPKKSPFEKAKEYSSKEELKKELLRVIKENKIRYDMTDDLIDEVLKYVSTYYKE